MEDETIHAKLDGIKGLIEEKFLSNAKDHKTLKEELDKKAGKWVETVAKTTIGTIVLGFLGALVGFVVGGGTALVAYRIIKIIV